MDKLEHYLDQVCRGIGGPRSLRQHIRQELREHLRDAAAEHRAAGFSEKDALDRALEDFGGPEEVRSELEATHGHRLMAVVIDKAMQWKEKTMRAKWLWTSWVHVALVSVVVLEVVLITFANMFLWPKWQKILQDVGFDPRSEEAIAWVPAFLHGMYWLGDNLTLLILLLAAAWGLFEWRVHSENKPLIRLSALGTTALGLMLAIMLTVWGLVVPLMLVFPSVIKQIPRPAAIEQPAAIGNDLNPPAGLARFEGW